MKPTCIVRPNFYGSTIVGRRFAILTQIAVRVATIDERIGIARIELNRFAVVVQRIAKLLHAIKGMTAAVEGCGVGRPNLDGLRIVLDRTREIVLAISQFTAIVIRVRVAWVELDGTIKVDHRFLHASRRGMAHAAVMSCSPRATQAHRRFEIG